MTRDELHAFTEWCKLTRGYAPYVVEDENGKFSMFHPSVGEELRQRGIIFGVEGHLRIRSEHENIIETTYPYLAVCDFCSERPCTWDVDCRSFDDAFSGHSAGGWMACQTCGEIIKRRGTRALIERILSKHDSPPDLMRAAVQDNMRRFWKHYIGIRPIPARPFGH